MGRRKGERRGDKIQVNNRGGTRVREICGEETNCLREKKSEKEDRLLEGESALMLKSPTRIKLEERDGPREERSEVRSDKEED